MLVFSATEQTKVKSNPSISNKVYVGFFCYWSNKS